MKKILSNPGFEFIFALSLIIILGVPPVLLAQAKKDLEIKIVNGDTTVNGKNIKDLSPKERKEALSDIKHLNGGAGMKTYSNKITQTFTFKGPDSAGMKGYHTFTYKQNNDDKGLYMTEDDSPNTLKHPAIRARRGGFPPMKTENITIIRKDSAGTKVETMRGGGGRNMDNRMGRGDIMLRRPGGPMMSRGERRNTQNFNYVSTDKDGIATHITFHVSDASNDDLKRMPHIEGSKFEVEDLNIVPEFTSGKTLLIFNLPSKAVAEVKLHDSGGHLLWSEKAVNGSFSKTFTMGLNGIYYLQIKQGDNVSVKKIMKDE